MNFILVVSCLLIPTVLSLTAVDEFDSADSRIPTRIKRQVIFPNSHHNGFGSPQVFNPGFFGGGFGGGFGHGHGGFNGGFNQGHGGFQANSGFGNIPPRCRGNKIRRPECRQFSRPVHSSQPGAVVPHNHEHCRGRKKHRPECQGQGGALEDAFNQITWLNDITIDNVSVVIPGLPKTPTANSQASRAYQLAGKDVTDVPFQACSTPRFEPGHCRYLRHCILPEFTSNFQVFLRYVCFIEGKFVGACCPDSRYPNMTPAPTRPTTLPTTTLRPPTPASLKGCGVNSFQQTKIVGGKDAELNKYPWAAALLKGATDAPTQYCGGVLISNKHVMTAAHCVDGFAADTITVRLGEYSFSIGTESTHKDFKLANLKMHESYDRTTFVNDIALLTLDRTTDLSKQIWPICLPPAGETFVGQLATVIGWGTIYFGGPVSQVLQEVSIPVWTNEECTAAYKDNQVFPLNLCAGDKAGGKDSCQGDSGGPLMLQHGPEKRWTVIGVVSWGIRCADPGTPGVYARVSEFLSWIESNSL